MPPGPILGAPGTILGPLETILGPLGTMQEPLGTIFEPICEQFGPVFEPPIHNALIPRLSFNNPRSFDPSSLQFYNPATLQPYDPPIPASMTRPGGMREAFKSAAPCGVLNMQQAQPRMHNPA